MAGVLRCSRDCPRQRDSLRCQSPEGGAGPADESYEESGFQSACKGPCCHFSCPQWDDLPRVSHRWRSCGGGHASPGALHLGSRLCMLGGFTTCKPSYLGNTWGMCPLPTVLAQRNEVTSKQIDSVVDPYVVEITRSYKENHCEVPIKGEEFWWSPDRAGSGSRSVVRTICCSTASHLSLSDCHLLPPIQPEMPPAPPLLKTEAEPDTQPLP